MNSPLDVTQSRAVAATYDERGDPLWRSSLSSPDSTFALCGMVPDRVIPVIFVPGVMGSNLTERGKADPNQAVRWNLDGAASAARWALADRNAAFRRRYLRPHLMQVDTTGAVPDDHALPAAELRRRGWGEVGALSYEEPLVWLENALSDFSNAQGGERAGLMRRSLQAIVGEELLTRDEVALSYRYRFPVHACGYNWLDSNAVAARRLATRIDEIRARYAAEKKRCDKVIIVTHSMGGLVARHCSEVLGYRGKIMGVIHGVMPAIGAAAVYRRFKAGTEDMTAWWNVAGAVAASALGNDAAEMTAVLSGAPGPMQLLPTPQYGNGWLIIDDGNQKHTLPKHGDPYSEIYTVRGKWWSLCEDHLINPLNRHRNPQQRAAQTTRDWNEYAMLVEQHVRPFHTQIANRYHATTHAFYGNDTRQLAYGNVTWTGGGGTIDQAIFHRGRQADVMNARPLDPRQIGEDRTVSAPLSGSGWFTGQHQNYHISDPEETGDGTVPRRSGVAPQSRCKSFLRVRVGHEPAFKAGDGADNLRACRFTLRAIVKIAQAVTQSATMRYE